MLDLAIFGTGSGKDEVESLLRPDCKIRFYVDNDKSKIGETLNNVPIIDPIQIKNNYFTYIIIASQYFNQIKSQLSDYGIDNHKIFPYFEYKDSIIVENMLKYKLSLLYMKTECEILVTGLSYAFDGINTNLLNKVAVNFALPSQDLYFDYYVTKSIFKNIELRCLKYQIIGLSYYSFHYDLTKSLLLNRALGYHFFTGRMHHLSYEQVQGFKVYKNIICDIFKEDAINQVYDLSYRENNISLMDKEIGKNLANKHSKKNYNKTVKENKEILEQYLKLLKSKNIIPIVIVFPVSKYYYPYFSKEMSIEFQQIIREMQSLYAFEFIDLFSSDMFVDNDFYDFDHLNKKGAYKVANFLNKVIFKVH